MSRIEIKNLTFEYENQNQPLFDHANLTLDTNWKLGLIGRNGRGKTTLLRLLWAQYPYQGSITGEQSFTYFPQKISDENKLVYELLSELSDAEIWEIERELTLLDTNIDVLWRPFKSLSGGEKTKVLLSVLFCTSQHAFPLIDEPTNHLDQAAQQQVAEYLKLKQDGFILVSHNRAFVDRVVDHVIAIEKHQFVLYHGNFSTYEVEKAHRDQTERLENKKLKSEIARLKQTAQEKENWADRREKDKYGDPKKQGSGAIFDTGAIGARAARTMKRSKHLVKRMNQSISEKSELLKEVETIDELAMNYQPGYHDPLLALDKIQLAYDEKPLFKPLSFSIAKGECVVLQGMNGSGKSSLLNYLMTQQFRGTVAGHLILPDHLKISYVRQDFENNRGTLKAFCETEGIVYEKMLNNLHKLGLERQVFQNKIEDMSMGQKKRVELAKSLSTPAELFIWDEPLNYLDVFNYQQIEQVIQMVQPTMLIVEHDETFIANVASKIIKLKC